MTDIFVAARMLPDYWRRQGHTAWSSKQEFEEHLSGMREQERVFWEMGKDDKIKARVDAIVIQIENQTSAIIKGQRMIDKIRKWFNQRNKPKVADR